MLLLKQFTLAVLSPLTVATGLFLIGFFLVLLNKQKRGLTALFLGLMVICLSGYGVLNGRLREVEKRFPPLTDPSVLSQNPVSHVVVLGSGHVSDPQLPVTAQINADSLARLVEGIRLQRRLPGSNLILSGGPGFDRIPNAEIMASVASEMGVPLQEMVIEASPRNTEEEAGVIRPRVGSMPFFLVTSAAHMPRAVEIFRAHGTSPVPAPTDFIFKTKNRFDPKDLFPSARNIALTEKAIYESMASAWHRFIE